MGNIIDFGIQGQKVVLAGYHCQKVLTWNIQDLRLMLFNMSLFSRTGSKQKDLVLFNFQENKRLF